MRNGDDILVEITVAVRRVTALWLIETAEQQGDNPQNVASRILDDVAQDDRIAHDEPGLMTLQ